MTNRHRFYRYLASGGVSTAAHYLTLSALVQMGTEPVLGSTIAALVGLVLNYSVSRRWVFDASAKIPETLARFALVWMLALLINAWALASLLALGFHYLVAQVTATGVLVLINFNLHRRWTFSGARVPPLDK